MNWERHMLTGWGRTSQANVLACSPETQDELVSVFGHAAAETILAYGGGRSYGDAALNPGGRAILTRRLNRIRSFDATTGEVVCEAGVRFTDLLDRFLPHGLIAPTSPGTAYVTIGGAVANDIHGKNHDRVGSFGDHVRWFDLLLPTGDMRRVTPENDPDLFAATVGGIGLTGVIVTVCFRLLRVPSSRVQVHEYRAVDLEDFMRRFIEIRPTAEFSVGWIDALARGRRLGRGILEVGAFATDGQFVREPVRQIPIPFSLPHATMSSTAVRLFNEAYYRRIPADGRTRLMPIDRFNFPLDKLAHWNRIYGRAGFDQFQCVLPDETAPQGLRRLLEDVMHSAGSSFLAVLKTLGSEGRGHLSFPMRGFTLALDIPRRRTSAALFARLEATTADHGGRIYLAKDSMLSAERFQHMYPRHGAFADVLARVDPAGRMSSAMALRLGLQDLRASGINGTGVTRSVTHAFA
jgi:decaprenylphospho-beta-D-ribofuranose 2-oxidase